MTCFKALLILLILLCCTALVASTLASVQAVDEGKTASRVNIRLSEAVDYQFNSSGNTISISLPGVKLGTSEAQYRRLSHVIDYISLSEDAGGSYVTIRLMAEFRVSHFKTGSGLAIQIGNPPTVKQKPAAQKFAAPKAVNVLSSAPVDTLASNLAAKDSLAQAASKPKPTRKPIPKYRPTCPELWAGFVSVFEAHPVVYGCCLLLILALLVILLLPRRLPKVVEEKKGPDLGLNGATLIMDSDTKARMISKLMEEGWTASEISQEMKLPLAEVEQIGSKSRFGD